MSEQNAPNTGEPDHHQVGLPAPAGHSADFNPATSPTPLSNTDYRHARFRDVRAQVADYGLRSRHGSPYELLPHVAPGAPRVTVVGVCSSGKSTLVRTLRERGYNARAVSQEHSYVPHLWQRSKPEVLIYLDASIHTIRGRSRPRWPQSRLDDEHIRLEHARKHCDIYIPTDGLAPEDVASRVLTYMSKLDLKPLAE